MFKRQILKWVNLIKEFLKKALNIYLQGQLIFKFKIIEVE
jgi:hypothetical protein